MGVFGRPSQITRTRLPDLRSVPAVEESQERSRLFEAVFRVLAALADQRPLVLIAEDLHWADAATVALLEFLAERLGAKRALLIGSYREDEASRLHPVRAARRRLEQSACAVELGLGPIDRAAVETLVGRLARRTTPASLPLRTPDSP